MPVDYEQLKAQISNAGGILHSRFQEKDLEKKRMLTVFEWVSKDPDVLEKLETFQQKHPNDRFAMPWEEPMWKFFPEPKLSPEKKIRLLACDGSQINPSRHDEIPFGMINTAVVQYTSRSSDAPKIETFTQLLEFDPMLSEDEVASRRDMAEKDSLAQVAKTLDDEIPTYALSDGSLELFSEKRDYADYSELESQYIRCMSSLVKMEIPAVGYIDRPYSKTVLRMLKLLSNSEAEEAQGKGVDLICDSDLFQELLRPGERSAVFQMNSQTNSSLPEDLRICFFYINVGSQKHPAIARVELPLWALGTPTILSWLHFSILEQCRFMMDCPYPYILNRAHESAVITNGEKKRIQEMLSRELMMRGMAPGERSNKQLGKDLMKA